MKKKEVNILLQVHHLYVVLVVAHSQHPVVSVAHENEGQRQDNLGKIHVTGTNFHALVTWYIDHWIIGRTIPFIFCAVV